MSTSEIALGQGLAGAGAPSDGSSAPIAAPGLPAAPPQAQALGRMLEQLANQYFAGAPGPALDLERPAGSPFEGGSASGPVAPPSGVFPSATSFGAGGYSPGAGGARPTPGFLQSPPIASGPLPDEADLRTLPAMLSEGFGISSPVGLARGHEPSPDAAPYFIELAGLPSLVPGGVSPATSLPGGLSGTSTPTGLPSAPGGSSVPAGAGPSAVNTGGAPPQLNAPVSADNLHGAGVEPSKNQRSNGASNGRAPSGLSSAFFSPYEVSLPQAYDGGGFDAKQLDRGGRRQFDPASVRADFPILKERINGRELVWFDNAATTQKPRAVIDRISYFYEHENSNIHRAAHTLAARSTDAYEGAREITRRFLNAPSVNEIIFGRGTTELINLVAQSWGRRHLQSGDEVVITWLEHHANIVPWQLICSERGARLKVAPVDDDGQVLLYEYEKLLGARTKFVSISHVSNALGTIVPVAPMVEMAHRHGAKVLVDGAQAVSHTPVDVQAMDCDFYVFSGHKIFGPTGIGALFGKSAVLDMMPPWQGGGNMIRDVTFEKTQFQGAPARFEAGTPNIVDAVGLGAALEYVSALGRENIAAYEHELLVYGTECLRTIPGLRIFGTAPGKAGVLSFTIEGLKTEDIGVALDKEGIAVRASHHCAQPILRRFGVETTVRASLAPYNDRNDIDALVAALHRLRTMRY